METDDAVALIEDLDEDEQQAVLEKMEPDDRAAVEEALELSGGIRRPPDAARTVRGARALEGRAGHRLPPLDEDLPTISGNCSWSTRAITRWEHASCRRYEDAAHGRRHPTSWAREQTLIPVDMDQEDVALRFQKYALVSAAVVDEAGRLVGMITVDDVVHIIQEEAGEDVLLCPAPATKATSTSRSADRPPAAVLAGGQPWHGSVAAGVVSLFQGEIGKYAVLAVLMPIVAGMGGNAGTQTLAVAVRALATNQLTESNTLRMFGRELKIALANGAVARPPGRRRRRR